MTLNVQADSPENAVRARVHFQIQAINANASATLAVDTVTFERGINANLLKNSDFEMITGSQEVADGWSKWESLGVKGRYQVVSS